MFAEEATHSPVVGADDELLKVLESECRRIVGPKPAKQDIVQQVRELIVDKLPKGTANIEVVASNLAMSWHEAREFQVECARRPEAGCQC